MNVAQEQQAVGRIYRMGQTRKVTITRLIVADSIEERIRAFVKRWAAPSVFCGGCLCFVFLAAQGAVDFFSLSLRLHGPYTLMKHAAETWGSLLTHVGVCPAGTNAMGQLPRYRTLC